MGSPLGPALANLFMGHHESNWLSNDLSSGIQLYKRYVDDIFCLFSDENQIDTFFNFINNQHPNIKFTFEKQINEILPFLDISIKSNEDFIFSTTTFRKKRKTN